MTEQTIIGDNELQPLIMLRLRIGHEFAEAEG
jgi:hypothetical protein